MTRRIATERVWRTLSGRHVSDGDLEAAFLVAAEGDEVPDEVIVLPEPEPEPVLEVVAEPEPEAVLEVVPEVEEAAVDGDVEEPAATKPKRASKANAEG